MSEAQFTPGPWKIIDCPCGHASCKRKQFSNVGTFFVGCGFEEADASLVAAAPQLFEALKDCRRYLTQFGSVDPNQLTQEIDDALRAASGTLTEGGDVEQAPSDSLSGPTGNAGDAQ